MKKNWVRLMDIFGCKKQDPRIRRARFMNTFRKHHRFADEIIYDEKNKAPLAAIYFTPDGLCKEQTKKIFRAIQERVLYHNELENKE